MCRKVSYITLLMLPLILAAVMQIKLCKHRAEIVESKYLLDNQLFQFDSTLEKTITSNIQIQLASEISYSASTNKTHYALAEMIVGKFIVKSSVAETITFFFRSGQRFDLIIYKVEKSPSQYTEIWRWSKRRGFPDVEGQELLRPNSSLTYEIVYKPGKSGPLLEQGRYIFKFVLTSYPQLGEASTVVIIE